MSSLESPRSGLPGTRAQRDLVLLALLLLLVLGGLAGLAASTGWDETFAALSRLSLAQVAALLALSLVNYLLRGLRWHLFATRLGLPTTLAANLRHFLGGFAMSITPGRVGELVRMRWIGRETGWRFERTAPLVLVDRAADLAAMALLLGAAVALSAGAAGAAVPVALLALALAAAITRPALLRATGDWLYAKLRMLPRIFARLRRAARALAAFDAPAVILAASTLGIAGWIAEGWAFHLLLQWMGADIGFWSAVGIFVFATLAGGLTGAPGGLGGAEAAMVVLLAAQGVPLEVAVPATLVIRLTTLWFAILIGLAVFPLAERLSQER